MLSRICVIQAPPRLALVVLSLWAASSLLARDPEAVLPTPPPQPVPRLVKVKRGEKVDIPLTIYGSQREEIRFIIRSKPETGALSDPAPRGREAAVARYSPPADLAITADRFSYSTKSSLGVSAAADVKIEILDAPAALSAPPAVEFPKVLAGASSSRDVVLSNSGGSISEGHIETDAPWKIEGALDYKLKPGARQAVKLLFAPEHPGQFDGTLRFTSEPTHPTLLTGEAEAAFAVAPQVLILAAAPGDTLRKGSLEIVNNTDRPMAVSIGSSTRLHAPTSVALQPRGKAQAPIETGAVDLAEISESVQLASSGYEVRVSVQSAPVGPVLRVAQKDFRFTPAKVGQRSEVALLLENAGGSPGVWRMEVPPPFLAEKAECKLKPGEKSSVPIRIETSSPGRFRTIMQVSGEQQTTEIQLDATVGGGLASARLPQQSRGGQAARILLAGEAGAAATDATQPDASSESDEAPRATLAPGPVAVTGVQLIQVEPTEATFSWPASFSTAAQFRLEERVLALDAQDRLHIDWAQRRASINRQGASVVAKVKDLKPGRVIAIRVVPIDPSGIPGPELFVERFMTPYPNKTSLLAWTLWSGGAILAIALLGRALQRRRAA